MGIGTVLADNPQLTTRRPRGPAKDPIRVVLDSRLRLPLTSRLLHLDSAAPTWVATTSQAPKDAIRALEARGAQVLVLPADAGRVSLAALLKELGTRQVQSLLVEGGAETLGTFFDQRLSQPVLFLLCPQNPGRPAGPGNGGRSRNHPPGRGPYRPGPQRPPDRRRLAGVRIFIDKRLNRIKKKPHVSAVSS